MHGAVRKRGTSWSYYFDLGKVNGKRKKKEKGGFRTKKEAEKALASAMDEYNKVGEIFEPTEIVVMDYLNEWFDLYCKTNLKYNTQRAYLNIINNHLIPSFGMYKLKVLTPALLQEYANNLKLNGYSKNHIVGILSMFSAALNYAVEPMHYLANNPMQYVKFPKVEKKPRERIILSLDEWERIRNRFHDTRYYIPLMIGFYTGLRISETFGLTWDDIDFEKRTVFVNKQVIKRFGTDVKKGGRASWYFTTPKTATSTRTVLFGETLDKALKTEKSNQLKNEMKYGDRYTIYVKEIEKDEKGNNMIHITPVQKCVETPLERVRLICVDKNGRYTSTDTFKYCSRVIHNELHLVFDYHSLRHTHATLLIESGANVKNVQTRLGHTNITTTLQTYVHDTEKMSEQSVDLFERITQ